MGDKLSYLQPLSRNFDAIKSIAEWELSHKPMLIGSMLKIIARIASLGHKYYPFALAIFLLYHIIDFHKHTVCHGSGSSTPGVLGTCHLFSGL